MVMECSSFIDAIFVLFLFIFIEVGCSSEIPTFQIYHALNDRNLHSSFCHQKLHYMIKSMFFFCHSLAILVTPFTNKRSGMGNAQVHKVIIY